MNLFKQYALLLAFVMTFSVNYAQDNKPKKTVDQKSNELTEKLNKEVKLSKEQISKIKAINTTYIEKKEVLDEKIAVIENEKDKLKKENKAKIDAILTDDQKKKKNALEAKKDAEKKKKKKK